LPAQQLQHCTGKRTEDRWLVFLGNQMPRIDAAGGRVVVIELRLSEDGAREFTTFLDLNRMVMLNGRTIGTMWTQYALFMLLVT
jgi:hypothetical protein